MGASACLSSFSSSMLHWGLGQNRRAPSPMAASASICGRGERRGMALVGVQRRWLIRSGACPSWNDQDHTPLLPTSHVTLRQQG